MGDKPTEVEPLSYSARTQRSTEVGQLMVENGFAGPTGRVMEIMVPAHPTAPPPMRWKSCF